MLKTRTIVFCAVLLAALMLFIFSGCGSSSASEPLPAKQRLRVATTTSLYDTGLWGYLEPMFEDENGVELDVLYAGTGKALEYGTRGDVHVITVHSKTREEAFVADGYGSKRIPFAYNYFLIVGPASDPAGIAGMVPEDAFDVLMQEDSGTFISRGDDSGTHSKEKAIWQAAGYDYEDVRSVGQWYVEAGSGMGATLNMANEKQAYTLTDMGTFLAYKGKLELVPIVDEGGILLNVYSVIVVENDSFKDADKAMAENLAAFLVSEEIQQLIGDYGVEEYGVQLFIPCAGNEPGG